MDTSPSVRLDELFFPVQEIRAVPQHNPQGDRAGTQLKITQGAQRIEGRERRYGFNVALQSDDENSVNPPYVFRVEAYAVLSVLNSSLDGDAELAWVSQVAVSIVIGAIRERLADLTSRAPWGRFLINVVPIRPPTAVPPAVITD
jgi:hypothetical protein